MSMSHQSSDPEPSEDDKSVIAEAYGNYVEHKGWDHPFSYDAEAAETFAAEIGPRDLAGTALLEIGFGNGDLLAWARDRGASVAGVEINAQALSRAQAAGIELLPSDLSTAAAAHRERFDTIVAFDVFEHLTLAEIRRTMKACAQMLKPGGRLILRFPNGQSPFGLVTQHGDVTHVTVLSAAKIAQIAPGTGLTVGDSRAAHRVLGRGRVRRMVRRLRYAGHSLVDALANFLYPAPERVTFAPVVMVELTRLGPGA